MLEKARGRVVQVKLTRPITVGDLAEAVAELQLEFGDDVGLTRTADDGRTMIWEISET